MIKALGATKPDGSRTLVLGLSNENWRRLSAHHPIPVRLQDLDPTLPPMTILIVGGPTEEQIYAELLDAGAVVRQIHYGPPEAPDESPTDQRPGTG